MDFYNVIYKTYNNGQLVNGYYSSVEKILLDKIPQDKEIKFTWDNLNELYEKYGIQMPTNLWNCKRGRMITFIGTGKDTKRVREWKNELNLTLKIEYVNISHCMSITDVLNWHESEKAIKYLKEKGLEITINNN